MQGFRAGVTPEGAAALVLNVTIWLLTHQDKVERHPHAGAYFDRVATIAWDLRKKFPREGRGPRPVFPRPCPVCGDAAMGVEWQSDQLQDFTLTCSYCGFEGDTTALLRERNLAELLRESRSEEAVEPTTWWTKKRGTREMRITPQTLNRYIQNDGLKTHTANGEVYVNADQLREIWRSKRLRDHNRRQISRAF